MMKRIFGLIVYIFCFAINPLSAKVDTLDHISEKLNKVDTTEYINIFNKFEWAINVRHSNGTVLNYVTSKPDTIFQSADIDTVKLNASFFIVPELRNKIFSLHYKIEGSVLIQANGHEIIATGIFSNKSQKKNCDQTQDEFKDIIFTDSFEKLDITYLPYSKTGLFNLTLKICQKQAAEERIQSRMKDTNEAFGFGFYYLAFGIVFISLFIFFRGKTENLYFALFCLFAALAFLWDEFNIDILYSVDSFFGVFCFEFLSIFFCKVLRNKEKSKIPLIVIACAMVLSAMPFIRYNYVFLMGSHIPWLLAIIYGTLYAYACCTSLYFLIRGIGQKQWEAKAVLIICFIPIVAYVLFVITFIFITGITGGKDGYNKLFARLFDYFTQTIIYVYPLAAVYILGKRNGLTQKQLIAQVASIQQLSDESLANEIEKKHILENQKESLEKEVVQRTMEIVAQKEEIEKQHDELKIEKKKSDDLLRNILPEEVAAELKEKGSSEAKLFDNVTVLFADFVDFTKAGEAMSPQVLVNELHACFKMFDEICSRYNIEKIKTIGDAYLAVCGLPVADVNHAEQTVKAAMEINEFMKQRQEQIGDKTFRVRIGIHTGSVVAGIVGVKKFAYDIWGDTVNTAARMEQSSEPGKINISQSTYGLIKDKFVCTSRGEIVAKNKGQMEMYFVETAI